MGMAGRGDEGDVAVVAEGPKPRHVEVSERTVIARINRLLAKDGKAIKVARELTRLHASMGWFHEIDTHRKLVTNSDIDLARYAAGLRMLTAWERLAEKVAS